MLHAFNIENGNNIHPYEDTTSTRLKEGYFARILIDGVKDEGQEGTDFEDKRRRRREGVNSIVVEGNCPILSFSLPPGVKTM